MCSGRLCIYGSCLFTLECDYYTCTVMAALLCRICLSDVRPNHSTALFSEKGLKLKWSERLSELLLVPVSSNDNLPPHICRSCKSNVESVESKLVALRQLARESYEKLGTRRKRAKHTCGILGVSPATSRARPPAKRMTVRRQLFPTDIKDVIIIGLE